MYTRQEANIWEVNEKWPSPITSNTRRAMYAKAKKSGDVTKVTKIPADLLRATFALLM